MSDWIDELQGRGLHALPCYQCHKRVRAVKIGAVLLYDGDDKIRIKPADEGIQPFAIPEASYQKHTPSSGGYWVIYEDGYQSYLPAEAFESGYTLLTDEQAMQADPAFGVAAAAMKARAEDYKPAGRTDAGRLEWLRRNWESQEFGETCDMADPQSVEAFRAMIDGLMDHQESQS